MLKSIQIAYKINKPMKLFLLFSLLISLKHYCFSKSDIPIGYTFTLALPAKYTQGFNGKAYLMETDQMPLNFRTALSVEAIDGRYACSLQIFLGNVKVWSSGHRSKFYISDICTLELTKMGDLRLKSGLDGVVGWRTGTSGQGVEKLQLLESGNLVLVDIEERIKWQTFNFPTNVLLEGQRLSVATHLTSFPNTNNSTISTFFSFEIHHDKIALYLNPGDKFDNKYSYWEFRPHGETNITYIELGSNGLNLFNDKFVNFSQITTRRTEPLKFLALEKSTGNIGLYYYSPYKDMFEASFEALTSTCDLPLTCSSYEICTFSKTCSCIVNSGLECSEESTSGLCGRNEVDMLELEDSGTNMLESYRVMMNVSIRGCEDFCLNDCKCASAMYILGEKECRFYDIVRGAKQVNRGSGLSYLVKFQKNGNFHKKGSLGKWVLILIVGVDVLALFVVFGGLGYFMVWKRKN